MPRSARIRRSSRSMRARAGGRPGDRGPEDAGSRGRADGGGDRPAACPRRRPRPRTVSAASAMSPSSAGPCRGRRRRRGRGRARSAGKDRTLVARSCAAIARVEPAHPGVVAQQHADLGGCVSQAAGAARRRVAQNRLPTERFGIGHDGLPGRPVDGHGDRTWSVTVHESGEIPAGPAGMPPLAAAAGESAGQPWSGSRLEARAADRSRRGRR